MNSGQRAVLGIGILAVLALGLFPPCIAATHGSGGTEEEVGGHKFIFSLPAMKDLSRMVGGTYVTTTWVTYRVDYARLGMMLSIVGMVTLGGMILFRSSSPTGTPTR